jgi:hypothetical protein
MSTPWNWTVKQAAPPIPYGCICAYTWGFLEARLVRNGPISSCPADHAVIDGAAGGHQ